MKCSEAMVVTTAAILLLCLSRTDSASCVFYTEDIKSACDVRNLQVASSSGDTVVNNTNCNELVSKSEFSTAPQLQFDGADTDKSYCLIMVDPDAPNQGTGRYYLHWIVANIKGADLKNGNLSSSQTAVISYVAPAPPEGTGPHRYMLYLLEQSGGDISVQVPDSRLHFDLASYVDRQQGKFCKMVAGTQFRAQYEG